MSCRVKSAALSDAQATTGRMHGRKFFREGVTDSLLRHRRPCSVLLVRCA